MFLTLEERSGSVNGLFTPQHPSKPRGAAFCSQNYTQLVTQDVSRDDKQPRETAQYQSSMTGNTGLAANGHVELVHDRQLQSTFFHVLPPELRYSIYQLLFWATRLRSGWRKVDEERDAYELIRPARNSLALLRACRRFSVEIDIAWIG